MWIKVCGITSPASLEAVLPSQPDAIGLNFYSKSRRCVTRQMAREILAALPHAVTAVGVFVNQSAHEIQDICTDLQIRVVQLHGSEPITTARELAEFDLIRALRVGENGLTSAARQLAEYHDAGVSLRAGLVDADVAGHYGGTGQTAPWEIIATGWQKYWPPLILAGGLQPDNIGAAIRAVSPWGIDVASGVESTPGEKDPEKVREFFRQARAAAASMQTKS